MRKALVKTASIEISATEFPQYARLIDFLTEVNDYAHSEVDLALKEIVENCRADLLENLKCGKRSPS